MSAQTTQDNLNLDSLTNVKLACDYISSNLTFFDGQNQLQAIPFEANIGTIKLGSAKEFLGFLETPYENPNMYKMDWHVSSDQTSYSFVVYVITHESGNVQSKR